MNPTESQTTPNPDIQSIQTPPTPPVTPPPVQPVKPILLPGARKSPPKWIWFVLAGCGGCAFLLILGGILTAIFAGKTLQEVSKALLTITPGAATADDSLHRASAEVFMSDICVNINQGTKTLSDYFSPGAKEVTGEDMQQVEDLLVNCTTFDSTKIENFSGPKYEVSGTLNYNTGETKMLEIDIIPNGSSFLLTYINVHS